MPTQDSLIGKQIDQFRIEKYLARGAMGMVYKAFDTVLARTVALKVIPRDMEEGLSHSEILTREEARKRLIQEAKAAGRLSHPNIVTIHCYGETEDLQYICMEFVEGKTLTRLLEDRKALPEQEVIPIMMQVLAALEAAGRENIIHRDIKPSNIMLTLDNRVKVMDFGIAKLPSLSMTITGMVLGTPFYMSPEQISGQKVDIRSDIFSTGAVLYELLTGQKPFPGDTTATLTYKILQTNPAPPTTINARISASMSAITLQALAKDPNERFQTPTEMLSALRRHQEKLASIGANEAATMAGPAEEAYQATVLADKPPQDTPAVPPVRAVEEPTPAGQVSAPKRPEGQPETVSEPQQSAQEGAASPHEAQGAPGQRKGRSSDPAQPDKGRKETSGAHAGSRALGVAALLLLVLAGAFIVYVSVRPPAQPPQPVSVTKPPVSPLEPQTVTTPPPAPPTVTAPTATPAQTLDSLLLDAGKNFVSNPGTAQKLLEEALAINPRHFESLMMLARLSSFQKDYAGAIHQYEAALRVNSQAVEAYFELGCLQVAQGDYTAAIRSLEACLALQPRNRDDVLTNLGFAYAQTNNPQQATRLYQEAIAFNPKNERAKALMASLPQPQQQVSPKPPIQPQVPEPSRSTSLRIEGKPSQDVPSLSASKSQSSVPQLIPDTTKSAPPKVEGRYSVEGANPNGSRYHGVATISRRDNRYAMTWTIGGQAFSGSGALSGNTLTITWKGPSGEGGVVTYTTTPSGTLKGVWANGQGSETLTPLK